MVAPQGDFEPTLTMAATAEVISVLGASSLQELARRVRDDDPSRLKFAAAVLMISESVEMPRLVPSPLESIEDQPAPEFTQSERVRVLDLPLPSRQASTLAADERKLDAPQPEGLRELEKVFEAVLDREVLKALQELDTPERERFLRTVAEVYQRNSRKPQFAGKQMRRIGLFMEGSPVTRVATATGDAVEAVRQSLKTVNIILRREPETIQGAASAVMAADAPQLPAEQPVHEASPVVPAPVEVRVPEPQAPVEPPAAEVAPTEQSPEQEDLLAELLKQYWSAADQASLEALLRDRGGEDVQAARTHIADLMSIHASMRPGHGPADMDILPLIQWETLSYLVGYNLPQGQKVLTSENVARRFQTKYDRKDTSFEIVVHDALTTLLKRATKDYAAGWYPGAKAAAPEPAAVRPAVPAPVSERAPELSQELQTSLGRLLRSLGDERAVGLMAEHFSGKPVDTESSLFVQASSLLRRKASEAVQAARTHQRNGGSPKRGATLQDERLVGLMLTDAFTLRQPATFQEILDTRKKQGGREAYTAAELRHEINTALRRIASAR